MSAHGHPGGIGNPSRNRRLSEANIAETMAAVVAADVDDTAGSFKQQTPAKEHAGYQRLAEEAGAAQQHQQHGAPTDPEDDELSYEDLLRCNHIFGVTGALSGFQWQAFVPSLALLLTRGLGQSAYSISIAYGVFVGCANAAFMILPLLLGTSETVARLCAGLLPMTPYAVLRLAFECRVISGVLHLLAIGAHVCGDVCALNHLTLALVLASRAIHGLTLLLMPLGVIYIGTRLPASERATALGERNMWAAAGTAGGLLAGSVGTAVLPNPIAAGAAPGVLLVLTSIGMWLWIGAKFVDRQPLPQDEGEGTDRSSTTDLLSSRSLMSQVPVTHVALTGASNILGWAGYLAIEGTLTMVLVDGFAWPTTSIIIGWVPISLAIFVGTIAFRQLRKELKWELSRLAALSSHAAFLGGALMVATLVVPSPAVASACFVASCSILICAFALGNTLANAQLLVWLPPHLQTRIQPPVQLLASIGRALGPALGVVAAMAGGGFERRGGLMLPMTWLLVSLCVWLPGVVFAKKFLATPPALNPPPTPSSAAAAPPKASNGTATAPQGNSAPSNGAPPANSGAAQAAAAPPTAAAPAGGAPPSA